eukprot:scaffold63558_cov33-Phaeocystis_antarctica.AAC.2
MQFGWSSCAHSQTSFCSSGRSFAPSFACAICLATASCPSSLHLKTVPKPPAPSLGKEREGGCSVRGGGGWVLGARPQARETLTLRRAEAALVAAATH